MAEFKSADSSISSFDIGQLPEVLVICLCPDFPFNTFQFFVIADRRLPDFLGTNLVDIRI